MPLATEAPAARTVWRPGRPVDLQATLGPLRRGAADPTWQRAPDGAVWLTSATPDGGATLRVLAAADGVTADAWGPGAERLVAGVPDLLGARDEEGWRAFAGRAGALPGRVRDAMLRHPGWRVPRSGRVWEVLVPTVLEQKVTGGEARSAFRVLVRGFGEPAPGPTSGMPKGMFVPPSPQSWARIPSWEWHRSRVGPERSATLVRAAAVAPALERTLSVAPSEAQRRLRTLRGVGGWSAAEVAQRAFGDPDAVSFGDLHLPRQVVFALTGRQDGDDGALAEVLAPWAGDRYRVVRMVELAGIAAPRRGPRYAPLDHRGR